MFGFGWWVLGWWLIVRFVGWFCWVVVFGLLLLGLFLCYYDLLCLWLLGFGWWFGLVVVLCFCFVCWVKCYNRFVVVLVVACVLRVSFEGGFGICFGWWGEFVFCGVFG